MDSKKNDRPVFSDAEYQRAHAAYEEFKMNGMTKLPCLRCGSSFRFIGGDGGLEIRCEKDGCFVERIRGV